MIKITLLDGKDIYVNAELIETIQETPDTILTLTTKKKLIVLNDPEDVVQKVIEYKHRIFGVSSDESDYDHYF
ncbi:flagellar protein [bacterium BMS3Abin05]|nr:flagellar protein [bacterium BMS3Abin05]GBE28827.1 flagellar protein [bacterium BMS3Bbin03]HDZ10573.1 flagellar protein FlbD [Bacteroidota bacterium]